MYKRITTMNQWGDVLYTGSLKKGQYKNIGDYPENLPPAAINEILTKLYLFEEWFEDITEVMDKFAKPGEDINV